MSETMHYDEVLQRHHAVYSNASLPAFNYSTVGERLMAGRNPLTAHDIHILRDLGVTHLLDLREAHEWAAPRFGHEALQESERAGIQRLHLPIVDMGAPTQDELSRAVEHIEEVLHEPDTTIYIHCRAGMERTAAVLIAFHASRHGHSYEEALRQLRRGRAILQPLPHQERAVRAWLRERGAAST